MGGRRGRSQMRLLNERSHALTAGKSQVTVSGQSSPAPNRVQHCQKQEQRTCVKQNKGSTLTQLSLPYPKQELGAHPDHDVKAQAGQRGERLRAVARAEAQRCAECGAALQRLLQPLALPVWREARAPRPAA